MRKSKSYPRKEVPEPESRVRGNSQARFGEGRQEKARKEPRLPPTLQHPQAVPCPARVRRCAQYRILVADEKDSMEYP